MALPPGALTRRLAEQPQHRVQAAAGRRRFQRRGGGGRGLLRVQWRRGRRRGGGSRLLWRQRRAVPAGRLVGLLRLQGGLGHRGGHTLPVVQQQRTGTAATGTSPTRSSASQSTERPERAWSWTPMTPPSEGMCGSCGGGQERSGTLASRAHTPRGACNAGQKAGRLAHSPAYLAQRRLSVCARSSGLLQLSHCRRAQGAIRPKQVERGKAAEDLGDELRAARGAGSSY